MTLLTSRFDERAAGAAALVPRAVRRLPRVHKGGALWHGVHLARRAAEREAIFRHRYDIYVAERGPAYPGADHAERQLRDPEDEGACHLYATDEAGGISASMRIRIERVGKLSGAQRQFAGLRDISAAAYAAQLARMCACRRASANPHLIRMMLFAYFFGLTHGVQCAFLSTRPQTASLYARLGYQALAGAACEGGLQAMGAHLLDREHLGQVDSPYLSVLALLSPVR